MGQEDVNPGNTLTVLGQMVVFPGKFDEMKNNYLPQYAALIEEYEQALILARAQIRMDQEFAALPDTNKKIAYAAGLVMRIYNETPGYGNPGEEKSPGLSR